MTETGKPPCPDDLAAAGRILWERVVDLFDLDEREQALLEVACRQAVDVAALEAVIASDGYIVAGSNGQPRLSMAVAEVRQGRLALGKLLGLLALPDEDDKPMTAASRAGKHAANARWNRTRAQAERLADGAT